MSQRALKLAAAALVSTALSLVLTGAAGAGGYNSHGANCGCSGTKTSTGKGVTITKPVTINKAVNIYKPVTINKDVNIYKPVTINKDVTINKTIDASKNITINKSIVIEKGGAGSAEVAAFAAAYAQASANASASASANNQVVLYNGYSEFVTVNNHGTGESIGAVQTTQNCQMQEASVVKAVHAVCVAPDGREMPASHMVGDTFLDSGLEAEILRCIPGARLKITIGDVLQTDQGMAGTYASGQVIECGPNEALRHFKDGMVKCTPKLAVKDCTERSNLRRWGTGDMFFSFRAQVCAAPKTAAAARELELSGMTLSGGVGEQ